MKGGGNSLWDSSHLENALDELPRESVKLTMLILEECSPFLK